MKTETTAIGYIGNVSLPKKKKKSRLKNNVKTNYYQLSQFSW